MTLTIGTGPFGNQSSGAFNFDTGALKPHTLYFEDSPRRVRVVLDGETIADCKRAKLMHETGLLPSYYFPQEDVRSEFLEESDHTTHCAFNGDASYWSVRVWPRTPCGATRSPWRMPRPSPATSPSIGTRWRRCRGLVTYLRSSCKPTKNEEPKSGLEPLTPAPPTSVRSLVAEGC